MSRPAASAPSISFRVNGSKATVTGDPMRRLSEVLRDDLGLTGTKVGCDAGDCGACTVRLDGDPVCACLVPLGQMDGRDVRTVEGLADVASLSPLQALVMNRVQKSSPPKAQLVMCDVGSTMRHSSAALTGSWQLTQAPPQCAIQSRPAASVVMPSG